MEQTELIEILQRQNIPFDQTDDRLIINGGDVDLRSLTTLPENVSFSNGGAVDLSSLTTLPENVSFSNGGDVDLSSLTTLPENVSFSNGGDVDLSSLTTLPENVSFSNGGAVYLRSGSKKIGMPYVERFDLAIHSEGLIVFKRVNKDFKTQEGTPNETLWLPDSVVVHANWKPASAECGEGKFHACALPGWCDSFRALRDDRYVAIAVEPSDLYEWKENPSYPQKIGFRRGKVLYECDRRGLKIERDILL